MNLIAIAVLLITQVASMMHLERWLVPEVTFLKPGNFSAHVNANRTILIAFADLNDGNMRDTFLSAIRTATEKDYPVEFGVLSYHHDADTVFNMEPLADSPCFVFYKNGSPSRFEPFSPKHLLSDWLNEQLFAEPALQLITMEQIERVSRLKFAVLLVVQYEDLDQMRQFRLAVRHDLQTRYYFTNLLEANNLTSTGAYRTVLTVFRDFEDGSKSIATNEVLSEERIREFAGMFRRPSIHPFNRTFVDSIFTGNMTAFVWFRAANISRFWNDFGQFAFVNRNLIDIYTCWMGDNLCMILASLLGHNEPQTDVAYIIHNDASGFSKYKLRTIVTNETINVFLRDYLDGHLNKYVKSEKEPAPGEENGVLRKAVRGNINRLVFKAPKDVVVFVYGSRTNKYREEFGVFESIALSYLGDDSVSFLTYDFDMNEHDSIVVDRLPTILIYPLGDKMHPKIYKGKFVRGDVLDFYMQILSAKAKTGEAMAEEELNGEF